LVFINGEFAAQFDSKILLKSVSGPINIVGVEKRSGGEHPHNYTDYELHIKDETFVVEQASAAT